MESVMELLYNVIIGEWCNEPEAPDSEYARTACVNSENLKLLTDSLSISQKKWFDKFLETDGDLRSMENLKNFCYAFHLGAQIMEEIIRGKEKLLK